MRSLECLRHLTRAVYGPENVTSGASSDITKATNIARRMVKVNEILSAI